MPASAPPAMSLPRWSLGADGVLLNTGIAHAKDPVKMATAMKLAIESGDSRMNPEGFRRNSYATAEQPV